MGDSKEPGKGPEKGQPAAPVDFAEADKSARIRHLTGEGRTGQPRTDLSWIREAAPYMSAAWTLTGGLLLGLFGGLWLDRRWDCRPWFTLGGLLLGVTVGLYEVARVALKKQGRQD